MKTGKLLSQDDLIHIYEKNLERIFNAESRIFWSEILNLLIDWYIDLLQSFKLN